MPADPGRGAGAGRRPRRPGADVLPAQPHGDRPPVQGDPHEDGRRRHGRRGAHQLRREPQAALPVPHHGDPGAVAHPRGDPARDQPFAGAAHPQAELRGDRAVLQHRLPPAQGQRPPLPAHQPAVHPGDRQRGVQARQLAPGRGLSLGGGALRLPVRERARRGRGLAAHRQPGPPDQHPRLAEPDRAGAQVVLHPVLGADHQSAPVRHLRARHRPVPARHHPTAQPPHRPDLQPGQAVHQAHAGVLQRDRRRGRAARRVHRTRRDPQAQGCAHPLPAQAGARGVEQPDRRLHRGHLHLLDHPGQGLPARIPARRGARRGGRRRAVCRRPAPAGAAHPPGPALHPHEPDPRLERRRAPGLPGRPAGSRPGRAAALRPVGADVQAAPPQVQPQSAGDPHPAAARGAQRLPGTGRAVRGAPRGRPLPLPGRPARPAREPAPGDPQQGEVRAQGGDLLQAAHRRGHPLGLRPLLGAQVRRPGPDLPPGEPGQRLPGAAVRHGQLKFHHPGDLHPHPQVSAPL